MVQQGPAVEFFSTGLCFASDGIFLNICSLPYHSAWVAHMSQVLYNNVACRLLLPHAALHMDATVCVIEALYRWMFSTKWYLLAFCSCRILLQL